MTYGAKRERAGASAISASSSPVAPLMPSASVKGGGLPSSSSSGGQVLDESETSRVRCVPRTPKGRTSAPGLAEGL